MSIGCEYFKQCYMKDLDCFFTKWDYCPHKDTVLWLVEERNRRSKELCDAVELDIKLQMELACI
jgi:hypothetical protein